MHHLRTFGCSTFIYKNNPESKVHARATPGILLGCKDYSVYIVKRLSDGKIENCVHVTFNEESFPGLEHSETSSSGESNNYSSGFHSESSESSVESENVFENVHSSSDDEVPLAEIMRRQKRTKRYAEEELRTSVHKGAERPKRRRMKPDRPTYNEGKIHRAKKVISFPIKNPTHQPFKRR